MSERLSEIKIVMARIFYYTTFSGFSDGERRQMPFRALFTCKFKGRNY
jgi:hypothetical protein